MKVLLDTSVYSQPIKKKPLASVVAKWRLRPETDYAISAIVELEVLYGVQLSGQVTLAEGYQRILKRRFPVLAFDAGCADIYARLQAGAVRVGNTRPVFDLMIAATALRHQLILATCNVKDFEGIEGLMVEDWS